MSNDVRVERTGWRCEEISKRHRLWGYNCPAVDLDFLVSEYNHSKPVALIEYKEIHAQLPDFNNLHPTHKTLMALADGFNKGALPFMIVFYCSQNWFFKVFPINDVAKILYGHIAGMEITEKRFVTSLYRLRKIALTIDDKKIINALNDTLPFWETA
jgi:hypothetical protein